MKYGGFCTQNSKKIEQNITIDDQNSIWHINQLIYLNIIALIICILGWTGMPVALCRSQNFSHFTVIILKCTEVANQVS